jgi:MtN3 and saliva related transmembrane protein
MSMVEIIGSVGATCTTLAFVPQVLQIWKTRSAKDVSLPMYITFMVGIICWFTYGVMLNAWPIIVANIITFALALAVILMKLRWG